MAIIKRPARDLNINYFTIATYLIIFCFLAYGGFRLAYKDRIFPNVVMFGAQIGGMTKSEAAETLDKKFSEFKILLNFEERNWNRNITQLDGDYDVKASAQRAFDYGRNGLLRPLGQGLRAAFSSPRLDPVLELSDEAIEEFIFGVEQEVNKSSRHKSIVVKQGNVFFSDPKDGLKVDRDSLKEAIKQSFVSGRENIEVTVNVIKPPEIFFGLEEAKSAAEKIISRALTIYYKGDVMYLTRQQIGDFIVTTVNNGRAEISLDEQKIANFVSASGEKYNNPAQDIAIQLKDGRAVFLKEGRSGEIIDAEKAISDIRVALLNRATLAPGGWPTVVTLAPKLVFPRVEAEDLNELGIKELIGKGQTSFAGSPQNRISNIKNGVKFLNGILIAPEEEFSTLKALGEIDGSSGYLPELVIKENATVPEFGGGLCQVSTTLFRSLLDFGFPILERRNHSYRVSYYEPPIGLDATIYSPGPDLRFKNDTPGHVLIRGYVSGTDLFFEIYGTHDGRQSAIEVPVVSNITPPPPPVYVESDTLAPGEIKQMEKPHEGADAVVKYIVRDAQGNILREQIFRSHYKAWPEKFLVGANLSESGDISGNKASIPVQ